MSGASVKRTLRLKGGDMDTHTAATQQAQRATDSTSPFVGKYISLTTFKRDGAPVATPVWFVRDDGRLLVMTDAESFKVKRIRRNPAVTIARCSGSGRLQGEPVAAYAEILPATELPRAERLMKRKYRLDRIVILPIYRAVTWLRGARGSGTSTVIAITPS
jgi:uncharacterized protein